MPAAAHLGLCTGTQAWPTPASCRWPPGGLVLGRRSSRHRYLREQRLAMSRDGSLAPLVEIPAFRIRSVCLNHPL